MGKYYTEGRKNYSWNSGMDAEKCFVKTMQDLGCEVTKAPYNVDRYYHIDYFVDGYGVDVKGNRHFETIWLELNNVEGKKGWLKGSADFVAFRFEKITSFIIFRTKDLLNYVLENATETTSDKNDYMKLYTRKNRKDVIVKVTFDHIKHLSHKVIEYPLDY